MLIDFDVQLFAALKMGFISAGLLFLLIYHWLRIFWRLRVDHVLPAVLLLYLMLIGYELMLLEPSRAPAKLIVVMGMALAVMSLCFDFTRSKAKVSAWTDRNIR
jgi:hypothetical protein